MSERSLGRVVSPDFTPDDVSHVSYGCVCLSRAYVIIVVGLSADNIYVGGRGPYTQVPTLLVIIPHTWSVPNAPPPRLVAGDRIDVLELL